MDNHIDTIEKLKLFQSKSLGLLFRTQRMRLGINKTEFARELNISNSWLTTIESALFPPKKELFDKICNKLNLSILQTIDFQLLKVYGLSILISGVEGKILKPENITNSTLLLDRIEYLLREVHHLTTNLLTEFGHTLRRQSTYVPLGSYLVKKRISLHLSRGEFAKQMMINKIYLAQIETNNRKPSPILCYKMLKALDCEAIWQQGFSNLKELGVEVK